MSTKPLTSTLLNSTPLMKTTIGGAS